MRRRFVRFLSAGAVGWLAAAQPGRAYVPGPYAPDTNTLHLWHLDETGAPASDAVSGGRALSSLAGGATLGNASYAGFGTCLSTYDGGATGTNAAAKDAVLSALALANGTGDNVTLPYAGADGAFSFEAIVRLDFDPAANLGPVTNGGNGRGSSLQILSGDGDTNPERVFQFRVDPLGANAATNVPLLEFININLAVGVQNITVPIPTNGADAIASNAWYHVAVTYDGNDGAAGNLSFYWTLMDYARTQATLLGTATMTRDLATNTACDFCIGNEGRGGASDNFLGLIDEVRMSRVARTAAQMIFAPPDVAITAHPTNQTVGLGQPAAFGVTATGEAPLSYQWRRGGLVIDGATNRTYAIAAAQEGDAGDYDVLVSNAVSAATSAAATLTVRMPRRLVWAGTVDAAWDSQTDNWLDRDHAFIIASFGAGDDVLFDDAHSAPVPTVDVAEVVSPGTVTVDAAASFVLQSSSGAGRLAGGMLLFKRGDGTLVLAVDGIFSGPTVIEAGTVQVGNGGTRGTLGAGSVTNGGALVFSRADTLVVSNALAGAGPIVKTSNSTLRLEGSNTLSGPVTVLDGTLMAGHAAALGQCTSVVLRTVRGGPGASGTRFALAGVSLGSGVRLSMPSTNFVEGGVTNDWRSALFGESGSSVWRGVTHLEGNNSIAAAQTAGAQLEIAGPVEGPEFSGLFTLRGGGLGILRGAVTMPHATLAKTEGNTWIVAAAGSSYQTASIVGGTLRLGADEGLATDSTLAVGNATFDLGGYTQTVAGLVYLGGTATIGSSSTNADSVLALAATSACAFAGTIANAVAGGTRAVGLTLASGTLALSGANTYTGPTMVAGGLLQVNGSLAATPVAVEAGGTLGGTGVLGGPVAVASGGTLAAGASIGTLTISNDLIFAAGSTNVAEVDLGTAAQDLVAGIGALTYGGTLVVTNIGAAAFTNGAALKLFDAASYAGAFAAIVPSAPGTGLAWDVSTLAADGTLRVAAAVVPVPAVSTVRRSGGDLVLQATNGLPGQPAVLWSTTNLFLPLPAWVPVQTNAFDAGGVLTLTNLLDGARPREFFFIGL